MRPRCNSARAFTPLEKTAVGTSPAIEPLGSLTGFTILETLLAAVLFIILVIAFLGALWTSFNYLRRVMELRTATVILQEEASVVRNLKFSDIQSLGGTFSSSGMASLEDASGSIAKAPYNGQAAILRVTFRIDWTMFDGVPASKTLPTLMTDHGINKK